MVILGRTPAKSYPQPGGVKVQVDGVEQAAIRDVFDLTQIPGVAYSVVDNAGNDSTDVTPALNGMVLLSETLNVSLRSTGNTLLFTVPGGQTLIVEAVILRCVEAVNITVPATVGIGSNAGADNIFASQLLTGLDDTGLYYAFPPGGTQVEVGAAGTVSIGVDIVATGTTQVVEVDLIGRLF